MRALGLAFLFGSLLLLPSCQRREERGVERRGISRPDSAAALTGDSAVAVPGGGSRGAAPMVVVDSPPRGALISSPVRVNGRARGSWYFEADFPVRLLDAHDKMIGTGVARAQGEWMTSDYVPFEVSIVFHAPLDDSTGTLVLEKSNPSGLPEHAAEVRVPVRFR